MGGAPDVDPVHHSTSVFMAPLDGLKRWGTYIITFPLEGLSPEKGVYQTNISKVRASDLTEAPDLGISRAFKRGFG